MHIHRLETGPTLAGWKPVPHMPVGNRCHTLRFVVGPGGSTGGEEVPMVEHHALAEAAGVEEHPRIHPPLIDVGDGCVSFLAFEQSQLQLAGSAWRSYSPT